MKALVHKLVCATAIELAGAFYEEAAKDNAFYKMHPNQMVFVEDNWSRFVVAARGTLGGMLGSNNYSQHVKDEIHEALQLDATLPNIQPKGQVVLDA